MPPPLQNNILKIRKVYDSFVAEFPLCYGYWKKYADHEARLGSIDKVVEVYERAVQGVTYSVDMWLHYCTFAISTYGDPDTVRRYGRLIFCCSFFVLGAQFDFLYASFWFFTIYFLTLFEKFATVVPPFLAEKL